MDLPEAKETLLYNFDYPTITESGTVQICDNLITLQFPEKPTVHVNESIKIPVNFNVFIANHQHFSLDWIPIHTWYDYHRAKDMFHKCFDAYSHLINNLNFTPHTFEPVRSYNSLNTSFSKPDEFNLNCFEDSRDTCIELSCFYKESGQKETPLHFQLCFGKNVVFCTQRDLTHVRYAANVHFIVQFILYKLKCNF
jgi:hypothetical protein